MLKLHGLDCSICEITCVLPTEEGKRVGARSGEGLASFQACRVAGKGAFELPFSEDDGVESCGFYPLSRGVQLFLTILLF